jgi:CHAD domain-containing protein
MKAKTLLLDSLSTRLATYKAGLKTCRREFSEEAVHDFRVALRRLLSFLDLLRVVIQDPKIQKMRRILKDQLDDLDDLRNAQALLADISEIIHENPALQPFQEYLKQKEKSLMRLARKEVNSLKTDSLARRIKKLSQAIEKLKQADLEISLFSAVDEAYAIVNQRYALVDPALPATIHRLRIAFKKFRYMIEVIYPILQEPPLEYLKRMHDYQAAMGDIQDMEVALQELTDFSELGNPSRDTEIAGSYYNERHAIALSRFIEDKGALITFWRPSPDHPIFRRNKT